VWRWEPEYFEPVCDGTGWTAEIVYPDEALHSRGSNCFPGEDGNCSRSFESAFAASSYMIVRMDYQAPSFPSVVNNPYYV
jgi:hypothetical protein